MRDLSRGVALLGLVEGVTETEEGLGRKKHRRGREVV